MGTLAQHVIATLQQAERVDELQEAIGLAADLLFKTVIPSYISGYEDVDNEDVTPAEKE